MKILLTGGAGFIGSHLTEAFIKEGFEVTVVDNLSHGKLSLIEKKAKFYQVDINDFDKLKEVFAKEKPQVINHHAAEIRVSVSGIKVFRDNVLGTLHLLELGKKYKINKFIFASSAAVYGESKYYPIKENQDLVPISGYGISKLTAEFYIRLYNNYFKTIIFRYSNVYGPRQESSGEGGVMSIFIRRLLNRQDCQIYGNGLQKRDFIYIDDVISANIKAIRYGRSEIFNISSNKEISILNLYYLVKKNIDSRSSYQLKLSRIGDIDKSILDNYKAKKKLNWYPKVNIEQGLNLTREFLMKE